VVSLKKRVKKLTKRQDDLEQAIRKLSVRRIRKLRRKLAGRR
jgi:prefoldin subunit 5